MVDLTTQRQIVWQGEGSDVPGGWSRDSASRNQGRFGEIGKKLDHVKQDGGLVDRKSFFRIVYNLEQFRDCQLARWRYWQSQWKGDI